MLKAWLVDGRVGQNRFDDEQRHLAAGVTQLEHAAVGLGSASAAADVVLAFIAGELGGERVGVVLGDEHDRGIGVPPANLATTVPGIFAVGDIRSSSMKRVASASGEGSSVVSLVHTWLEPGG